MIWMDQAYGVVRAKMHQPPTQHRTDGLGGVSLSMFRGGKYPAQLRSISERRLHLPFVVGKTGLTNKISGYSFFHHPVSKTKQRPMTEIA